MKLHIPSESIVLVCDGRKALFLRNFGDALYPDLRVTEIIKGKINPPTSKQGTDRPGRTTASGERRSAVDQTDWHTLEEVHFAHEVALALQAHEQAGDLRSLIVVAPAKTLAELRSLLSDKVNDKVLDEIAKDLTKHPMHEIERLLTTE